MSIDELVLLAKRKHTPRRARPNYKQPYNIQIPEWIQDNPALADKYREKEHGRQKYQDMYKRKPKNI